MAKYDLKDSGYKSRKFWLSIFAISVIFTFGVLAGGKIPGLQPMYGEFVGGIVAIISIYSGGNLAHKYFGTKIKDDSAPEPDVDKK